jgi:hypothetical protein
MKISRKASLQAKVKVGVVKEIVRKIDGASRQDGIGEKKVEAVRQANTAEKIDEAKGQEGTAKIDTENGHDDTAKKVEKTKAHESIVEQHIEYLIDHVHRLSRAPQSTPSKAVALASIKSKTPQFAPQTPPQLDLDTKPTTPTAGITSPSSIYSASDYGVHDLHAAPARLSPTPQTTPFKSIVQATTKSQTPPQTPPQRQLNATSTAPSGSAGDYTPSIYSSSSSSHYSTSSYSDSFYISTSTSQPTTPLTPQTSFSSNPNAGVIYGGTSLLHAPIDGTKWNWDGAQWVGTRTVFAAIVEEDDDEEFSFRRMRNGA